MSMRYEEAIRMLRNSIGLAGTNNFTDLLITSAATRGGEVDHGGASWRRLARRR